MTCNKPEANRMQVPQRVQEATNWNTDSCELEVHVPQAVRKSLQLRE